MNLALDGAGGGTDEPPLSPPPEGTDIRALGWSAGIEALTYCSGKGTALGTLPAGAEDAAPDREGGVHRLPATVVE